MIMKVIMNVIFPYLSTFQVIDVVLAINDNHNDNSNANNHNSNANNQNSNENSNRSHSSSSDNVFEIDSDVIIVNGN